MSERVNRPSSSVAALAKERRRNLLNSPSLDSDVISGSILPSSISEEINGNDSGWVLFSPQIPPEDTALNGLRHDGTRTRSGQAMLEPIEPLDLTLSAITQPETTEQEASWALPSHNGTGAFSTPSSSRLDLFERVNAWRMEQSEMTVDDTGHRDASQRNAPLTVENDTVWKKIKENATRTLEQCFAWDEKTIDALFSKEFPRQSPHALAGNKAAKPEVYTREHLSRAQKHGPAGWEERILRNTVHKHRAHNEPSLLYSVLSQLLAWSKLPDSTAYTRNRHSRLRASLSSAFDNGDHSYHMGAIQGSIATVSSTMSATPWSETWESGTSTSMGLAAA